MKKPLILSVLLASILSVSSANEQQSSIDILKTMFQEMKEVATETFNQKSEETNITVTETETVSQTVVTNSIETNQTTFEYKLEPKQIIDNVWCFFGVLEGPSRENAGAMANNCYIKTSDSYVVFDSGPSYEYAKQTHEKMKKIADLPVKIVINSHEHDDHWLGNNFYKEEFNAKLIGPDLISTEYKEGDQTRMFKKLPASAIKGTKIINMDESPKEPIRMVVGGEEFEIVPIGTKAHTPEDYFMYMPQRKILFAGDLVMNGRVTSNRHGSLLGQLKAIEMMKSREWDNLIPGHGFITDKTAIDEADQYFTQMKERLTKALEDDVELTDIDPTEIMSEFKDKAMFKALNGQNVTEAFTELDFAE